MQVNVGILGFAHGHVNAYCTQWMQNPEHQINLVAAWDHDAARLAKNAAAFDLLPYDSVDAFLAHPDLQAVVIASETSMHAELVERAAAAHKMIALQKPIALTMAEADRIVAAVEQHSVPFTLAWQMRVDPQNIAIKELMASGELGKTLYGRRRHGLPTQLWDISTMWHFDPALNRDIWADDSAHPIDFIQWLLGVPESVTAELTSNYIPEIPNVNGIVFFRYADGLLAEVSCSFSCLAAENTTEVIAEKGSIVQNYGDVPSCNVPRPADVLRVADHADLPHAVLDLDGPVGHEPVLAVERLGPRVRIGDPQSHRLLGIDDRLQQRRSGTRAVVGRKDVEHVQLPRPRRVGLQGRARHGDADHLAVPLGDGDAVAAVALVGQRGCPEVFPRSREARMVEHRVRHEAPVRLLPAPHVHERHLHGVLGPGRANSRRSPHRRIVGGLMPRDTLRSWARGTRTQTRGSRVRARKQCRRSRGHGLSGEGYFVSDAPTRRSKRDDLFTGRDQSRGDWERR